MWKDDDKLMDYRREVRKSFVETVVEYGSKGADIGGKIGSIFGGKPGEVVGNAVGAVVGGICGAIVSLFDW